MLYVIAQILEKYIFVLSKAKDESNWLIFTPYGSKTNKPNEPNKPNKPNKFNSIFLFHQNKSHYLAMLPKEGYIFKEKFNNFNSDKYTFNKLFDNKILEKNVD
jgi:hypothetical protein